jgi:hypothetical protein
VVGPFTGSPAALFSPSFQALNSSCVGGSRARSARQRCRRRPLAAAAVTGTLIGREDGLPLRCPWCLPMSRAGQWLLAGCPARRGGSAPRAAARCGRGRARRSGATLIKYGSIRQNEPAHRHAQITVGWADQLDNTRLDASGAGAVGATCRWPLRPEAKSRAGCPAP